jgi:hypothetical protein
MIQARETMIQHTPSLRFPLEPMAEAALALQQFLRWHCPGLGNYQFRSHTMLESFLLEARELAGSENSFLTPPPIAPLAETENPLH